MLALFNQHHPNPNIDVVLTVFWDTTEEAFYVFSQTLVEFADSVNTDYFNKADAISVGTTDTDYLAGYFFTQYQQPFGKTQENALQKYNYTNAKNDRITFILQSVPAVFPYVKAVYDFDLNFCDLQIDSVNLTATTATILATSSKSGILYSLDNANFQVSNIFTGLSPQTQYTIYVKDSGGCKDQQSFKTLEVSPTYGLKYTLNYTDYDLERTDIQIYEQNFVGVPYEFCANGGSPLTIGMRGNPVIDDTVKGTYIVIRPYSKENYKYLDLFIDNPLRYLVVIKKQNEIFWQGLVEPETYSEEYKPTTYSAEINCNDGLAYLKEVPFLGTDGNTLQGKYSFLDILVLCFANLPYDFDLHFAVNTFETRHDQNLTPFAQTYVDSEVFAGDSCYEVIYKISRSFGCKTNYWFGAFHFTEVKQPAPYRVFVYSKNGTFKSDYYFDPVKPIVTPNKIYDRWIGGDARLELVPAAKSFTNVVNLTPKQDLISGFTVSDFELIGDKNPQIGQIQYPQFDYSINLGYINTPNIGNFSDKTLLDSTNNNQSYLKPSLLRNWQGSSLYYFVNDKKDVGIKLPFAQVLDAPKSIFTSADFLLPDPQFTDLVTGQRFPHKLKIEFDYILECDDPKDDTKEYNFRFAFNVNGQTQFFSVESDKFTTNINQFNTAKQKRKL